MDPPGTCVRGLLRGLLSLRGRNSRDRRRGQDRGYRHEGPPARRRDRVAPALLGPGSDRPGRAAGAASRLRGVHVGDEAAHLRCPREWRRPMGTRPPQGGLPGSPLAACPALQEPPAPAGPWRRVRLGMGAPVPGRPEALASWVPRTPRASLDPAQRADLHAWPPDVALGPKERLGSLRA